MGRGCLAFRHRGVLRVQFHESAGGRARDRGRSGKLRRAGTQACRNGIRRPVRGGGKKHPVTVTMRTTESARIAGARRLTRLLTAVAVLVGVVASAKAQDYP